MIIKIICLLVRLDLKLKIKKGLSINVCYHDLFKQIGYIYSDIETEYYLNNL